VCLHTPADARVTATLLDGHDAHVYLAPVARTLPPGHTNRLHLAEIPLIVCPTSIRTCDPRADEVRVSGEVHTRSWPRGERLSVR
jgi:hypothetical protein